MSDWQPIETAPKMKTIIVFAVTDIKEDGSVNNWMMTTAWRGEDGIWSWDGHRRDRPYDIKPTHWQPLPGPPETTAT